MDFQRARTEEQITHRQKEIIDACDALYGKSNFDSVSIKAISELTSFTRSSIYNYYKTKEEIFLDLMQQEYMDWYDEVKTKFENTESMTKNDFCQFLTGSLVKREKMLRLLSIHLTAIENNCRIEKLIEFKKNAAVIFKIFYQGIDKFFPSTPMRTKKAFRSEFFIYVFGIYPFTHMSRKQKTAMKEAHVIFNTISFERLCFHGMSLLAAGLIENDNC
ncbi:TetR family transcriptional regulator [Pectinatus haikarae]|uniref:AcrR family transcriptional regulator n=1 Tax=Pectinatus haikarae TaxID=349096 RepID=A0ABT9YA65_9FIRM|nr:TetR family transcriptional regulator [Pectinatus haikarae]MDQ0204726.1 AcrR family transcriptional regulator [Pectinatus haikarae]